MTDLLTRRRLIKTEPNPDPRLDYVISLSATLNLQGSEIAHSGDIRMRYIPDQLILVPASFSQYLERLGAMDWAHLEELGAVILDDLRNELVARWIQVKLSHHGGADDPHRDHHVLFEDKQPQWAETSALSRLGPP